MRSCDESRAVAAHLLVFLGKHLHGLAAARAALLATGDTTLGFLQLPLRLAIVPRIVDRITLGGDEKYLQADINTRFLTSERQRLCRHIDAGEAHIPPIGCSVAMLPS